MPEREDEHLQVDEHVRMGELLKVSGTRSEMTYQLEELIEKFKDVFGVRDSELTQTNLVEHNIDTGDSQPIKQRTPPVPMGVRKGV
ncbi:hypothetical protein Aduo_018915 [Ancylostoma duodenale]